jgi:hypothetical protein
MYPELKKELETFERRTPKSAEAHKKNLKRLPLGVASNYRAYDPYPIFVKEGSGSHFRDVDGNDYKGEGDLTLWGGASRRAARSGRQTSKEPWSAVAFENIVANVLAREAAHLADRGRGKIPLSLAEPRRAPQGKPAEHENPQRDH